MEYLNQELLRRRFNQFTGVLRSLDGEAFGPIWESPVFIREEGFKGKEYDAAKSALNLKSWSQDQVGSGLIAQKVQLALDTDSLLVRRFSKAHFDQVVAEDALPVEKALYGIYFGESAEESFRQAMGVLGAKYDLIAFLFFLKDKEHFLPTRPREFEKRLGILGIDFQMQRRCSWENYSEFIAIIGSIRDFLESESPDERRPTLLEAHSFVWMQWHIEHPEVLAIETGGEHEFDGQIVNVLIRRLETTPSTIEYGELKDELNDLYDLGLNTAHFLFDEPLGRIQTVCDELGLPCLCSMVVLKNHDQTTSPGKGFANCYRERHPEAESLSDKELFREQWGLVRKCGDWQKILDWYEIEEPFKGVRDIKKEEATKRLYSESRRIIDSVREEVSRSRETRESCLAYYGATCQVCGFNSLDLYDVEGIIHVHHLNPVAEIGLNETRNPDPIKDLRPVCPNCHALIHSKRGGGCYSIEQARLIVEKGSSNKGDS